MNKLLKHFYLKLIKQLITITFVNNLSHWNSSIWMFEIVNLSFYIDWNIYENDENLLLKCTSLEKK